MYQPDEETGPTRSAWLRERLGHRAAGIIVALALEALLILLLFTLGVAREEPPEPAGITLTTFDAGEAEQEAAPEPQETSAPEPNQPREDRTEPRPQDTPPTPEEPAPATQPKPAFIPMSRDQMANFDISNQPQARPPQQRNQVYGPANVVASNDSPRVGTAPNGEPMYAARWYREPTHQEMAGYLSTASGPGWGLIACKTAPDYRVEDCVALDEYPNNVMINRAAIAASWQFRVRPPRIGGKNLVGEWVRIRIDYRQQIMQR